MRQTTLQAVTLETLSTATQAVEHTVAAYRTGGHRLLSVIQQRLAAPTAKRTERFAPRLAAALRRTNASAQSMVTRGIDRFSTRTSAVIEATSQGMRGQVKRVARIAKAIDSPLLGKGIDAVVRLSMPGAKAALALTERVAAVAGKLPVTRKTSKAAVAKRGAAQRAKPARAASVGKRAVATRPVVKVSVAKARKVAKAAQAAQADVAVTVRRARKAVVKTVADLTPAAKPARRRVAKAPVEVVVQA